MTDTSDLPALTPLGPGPNYEATHIWLPQLFAEAARGGARAIENRTFVRCEFEGPGVILPISCDFAGCDMGEAGGDIRNLLLRPVGERKAVGAIVFKNCTFRECGFFNIGFTGPPAFIDQFIATIGSPSA